MAVKMRSFSCFFLLTLVFAVTSPLWADDCVSGNYTTWSDSVYCGNTSSSGQCLIREEIGKSHEGSVYSSSGYYSGCTIKCIMAGTSCRTGSYLTSVGYNRGQLNCTEFCSNKCAADSIACLLKGDDFFWNSGACTCDSVAYDTTYKCVNGTLESSTYGDRAVARLYKCVGESCTLTATLNGTCQDWGWCESNQSNCDIPPDSSGKNPCHRAGGNITSSTRCYYNCPDGSSLSCAPTSTQYVAGAIWGGYCPDTPPESCLPPPSSSSNNDGSSSSYSSSSSSDDRSSSSVPPDTLSNGNIDYTQILNAIKDTLHKANLQRGDIESWNVDYLYPIKISLDNIEQYSLNDWQRTNDINNKLTTLQDRGLNLTSDISNDIDSAHILLREINEYLRNDTISVSYPKDTSYNPLLRDIKRAVESSDSSGSSATDSVYQLLKPYFADSGQYDSPVTKFLKSVTDNLFRDSSSTRNCDAFYACLRSGSTPADCFSSNLEWESCYDGGTPLDGMASVEMSILETLWNGLFGDDSTDIPRDTSDGDTSFVPPPEYSSASLDVKSANDSLGSFDIKSLTDSVRALVDSVRRNQQDSVKIQPDSLWLDSAGAAQYVEHILLPSGTGTDCFICQANLGDFNGLTDTSLTIYIDFSDFGGYNWCEIIRAVVKIATLVTCISLTLGSWAAAFGYNPKNDA